ncbi:MAG: hypothetical protein WBN39_13155 [Flavobacteriaceae bacterium]
MIQSRPHNMLTGMALSLFAAIFAVSCGSYQQASYYDNDGIYATGTRQVSVERPPRQAPVQQQQRQQQGGDVYSDYFGQQASQYDNIGDGDVFTDVDSYSSQMENDSIDQSRLTDYYQSENDYVGQGGWGDNPSNVNINIYDNRWAWGGPWYGNRWGNGGYYGYNRNYGYNRSRRGYYRDNGLASNNLNNNALRGRSNLTNSRSSANTARYRSNTNTLTNRNGNLRSSRNYRSNNSTGRTIGVDQNRAYRTSRSTRAVPNYNRSSRTSPTYRGGTPSSGYRSGSAVPRTSSYRSSGNSSRSSSGRSYRSSGSSSRSSGGSYRSSGGSSRSSGGSYRSSGGSSRSSGGSVRSSGGSSRSSGGSARSSGGSRSSGSRGGSRQ